MNQNRKDRFARNEASFRSINETLGESLSTIGVEVGELAAFVCECGHPECSQLVQLPLPDYERIRGDSRRFLIVPGHDIPGVEDVVDTTARFAVVQKHEDVRDIVEASDARRDDFR